SGGRGGNVFDSGRRSGAIWGNGVGAGEPSGAACCAREGDDSTAPGRASCASNANWNGAMPSDREKHRTAINQEILARERVLTLLLPPLLTKNGRRGGIRTHHSQSIFQRFPFRTKMLTAGSAGSQPRRATGRKRSRSRSKRAGGAT